MGYGNCQPRPRMHCVPRRHCPPPQQCCPPVVNNFFPPPMPPMMPPMGNYFDPNMFNPGFPPMPPPMPPQQEQPKKNNWLFWLLGGLGLFLLTGKNKKAENVSGNTGG